MPESINILQSINISELITTYLVPWGKNIVFAFPFPSMIKALCWSLIGLAFIPMVGGRWGYEVASLAADQVLFFGALLSLLM